MENIKLIAARKESGLTQQQAADQVGIKRQAYSRYEKGESEPGVKVAIKICEVLKVSVEEIFKA